VKEAQLKQEIEALKKKIYTDSKVLEQISKEEK